MTVLRRLGGVSYWVIEDPGEIFELVDTNLRAEWESDCRDEGKDPKENEWLKNLAARRWRLETVKINGIRLNQELMGYSDARTGYDFAKRLRERSEELRREIEADRRIIPPLVLRAEDNQLMDGYCRYSTLKSLGVKSTYAYVGGL